MLTLAVLYGMSQSTCKVSDARDVTPTLLDIGISSAAATWRVLHSLIRLYKSVGVRIVLKNNNSCFRKCIPKKISEVIYPPNTRVQCCIFPFFIGLILQLLAIAAGSWVSYSIWTSYVQLQIPNFDDCLAIYHFTLAETDVRVLEISGTIIPPNGSYVSLEQISDKELQAFEMTTEADVFCLSEFEYRSEDFGIYFNVAQLFVVPNAGEVRGRGGWGGREGARVKGWRVGTVLILACIYCGLAGQRLQKCNQQHL